MDSSQLPVYLVHWNAPDWVASSVASIVNSNIPVAVTIIDNGPPSATAALDLPSEVRVVPSGGNLGYTGGANLALRDWLAGEASWCVVGAHDLQVGRQDLGLMLKAARATTTYGILGPGTEHYYSGELLGRSEGVEQRSVMSGTCLMLNRHCIEEIGLFDIQFGSYGEDDELCARAQRHGWKVGRVPGTWAAGMGTRVANRRRLEMRNRVMLALKTSGRRAAIGVLVEHLRVLLKALSLAWLPGERGEQRRWSVGNRWYGLSRGLPLIWTPMKPPPSSTVRDPR